MKSIAKLPVAFATSVLVAWVTPAYAGSLVEYEPNHPIDSPQYVVSSTSEAQIDGELKLWNQEHDLDFYSFYAKAGDVLTLDIDGGYGVGTSVDTVIALFGTGPGYPMLRINDDGDGLDPGSVHRFDSRIDNFLVPETGVYVVGVSSYPRFFRDGGEVWNPTSFKGGDYELVLTGIMPSTKQITINIKPGRRSDDSVPLNPRSRGKIPVAILSSPDFNPLSVDVESLRFGATGTENSLFKCNSRGADVNGDGRLDLICHFNNQDADFEPGDLEGILTGRLNDSSQTAIEGRGWLKVKPEKRGSGNMPTHAKAEKVKSEKRRR